MTELVFILDRSGSMSGLEKDTIGGFNSMLEKQRKEPGDAVVSTVLFDNETEVIHDRVVIADVPNLTDKEYFVAALHFSMRLEAQSTILEMFISMPAKKMCRKRPSLSSQLMVWKMPAIITPTIRCAI